MKYGVTLGRRDKLDVVACLDDDDVAAILAGGASEGVLERAKAHSADCEPCRALLASIGRVRVAQQRGDTTSNGAREQTERGDPGHTGGAFGTSLVGESIGRFVVVEPIGQGGMGTVYSAHDETLHRKVAIKLLRSGVVMDGDGGRGRLLREARAMATVSHPNVVAVHEAGVHRGDVFVVMDLIDGVDLQAWGRTSTRSADEILDVWAAAGVGLAAIHRRGLVHRDFKPANVLVGRDGQVRVTDFGLVGLNTGVESVPELDSLRDALGHDQTETGTVLGTPRYMAPEQLRGRQVDAAADQFAFCVSLWIALTERHPFGEGDVLDRVTRMRAEDIAAPRPGEVPARVFDVLRRGLRCKASDRWPSMDSLLRQLDEARQLRRRRRRVAFGALGASAALSAGVMIGGVAEPAPCEAPAEGDFARVWDDEARVALSAAVRSRPATEHEWSRIEAHLDNYAQTWSTRRRQACEATRVRRDVSEDLLDRRMVCLDRRRAAVATLVGLVSGESFPKTASALDLALRLPDVEACDDLRRLSASDPLPADPGVRERVAALSNALDEVEMLQVSGQADAARERLAPLRADIEELEWPVGKARVLRLHAFSAEGSSTDEGVAAWREAYVAAIASGSFTALSGALDGVGVLSRAHRIDEAAFLLEQAEAYAAELGGEPQPGQLAIHRAYVAVMQRDVQRAEEATREAIAQLEAAGRTRALADAYGNLGGIVSNAGRREEGSQYLRRQLTMYRELYGPGHAKTLAAEMNQAVDVFNAGRYAEAEAAAAAVLEGQRKLGSAANQAQTMALMGKAQEMQEKFAAAIATQTEVLRLRRTVLPPKHPQLAWTMIELAQAQYGAGEHADAEETLMQARPVVAGDDPSAAYERMLVEVTLSAVLRASDRPQQAVAAAERAVTMSTVFEGQADAHKAGEAHEAYAEALLAVGRVDDAGAAYERAWLRVRGVEGVERLKARLELARAKLSRRQGDEEAAKRLAQSAHDRLDAAGDRQCQTWREVEALLASVGE